VYLKQYSSLSLPWKKLEFPQNPWDKKAMFYVHMTFKIFILLMYNKDMIGTRKVFATTEHNQQNNSQGIIMFLTQKPRLISLIVLNKQVSIKQYHNYNQPN
jgi:hypothetical protein